MSFIPTLGVEEEFLLLDPLTGRPVPAAPDMLRRTAQTWGPQAELMQYQIEAATGVCTGLDEVHHQLWALRRRLSVAAAEDGCRLVASGISPYANPGLAFVTDDRRYRELAQRYPGQTAGAGTCACHVHVAVPTRDVGVRVLARLRPWLAPLLAVSANSPISAGRPSGWRSRRFAMVTGWPTARPPAIWRDGAHYDRTVRTLIGRGAALDERSVYFLARLSPRYPTVEVRVTDVCPDIDTAVLIAALVRGLVMTAMRASSPVRGTRAARTAFVEGALLAAGRNGLGGTGVDACSGRPVGQCLVLERMRAHVDRALSEAGDQATVDRCLALLTERGTGADRQMAQWELDPSPAAFTRALARITLTAPASVRHRDVAVLGDRRGKGEQQRRHERHGEARRPEPRPERAAAAVDQGRAYRS